MMDVLVANLVVVIMHYRITTLSSIIFSSSDKSYWSVVVITRWILLLIIDVTLDNSGCTTPGQNVYTVLALRILIRPT